MNLNDENARIVLLGCIMSVYVLFGAVVIRSFESPFEKNLLKDYRDAFNQFEQKLQNGTAKVEELTALMHAYGNITSALGDHGKYERWNFLGSLHFVVTIVTTIGYGSYTPNTNAGKIFVILYGFVGCAGGILFFNLFLERMITFLAYFLRELYIRKLRARNPEPEANEHVEQLIAEWKPGIYSVMLCLFLGVVTVGSVAVPTYSMLEGWSYVEAAYFCFVSFATIGFGDFVAAQHPHHSNVYVLVNIIILAVGCCFLYSIFNVISIVLKQILNWLIFRMKALKRRCCRPKAKFHPEYVMHKHSLRVKRERKQCRRGRKSSIQIIRKTFRRKAIRGEKSVEDESTAGHNDDDANGDRKLSDDGLISMKDFLTSNQVSLALMQKQLQDSAQQAGRYSPPRTPPPAASSSCSMAHRPASSSPPVTRRAPVPSVSATLHHPRHYRHPAPVHHHHHHKPSLPAGKLIPSTIGPLAILCDKLGNKR